MNPLNLLEDPIKALLDVLHDRVHLTYGWTIVILTVIVRMCLLPLVVKQYKSMRRLQAYAPRLKELQAKYKGNRQKLGEETMRFYKEHQINPAASCLPMVFQFPVFIALYYVLKNKFKNAAGIHGSLDFMWIIPDIHKKLVDIGWTAAIVAVIYGMSQLLSTELSATPQMSGMQRKLMRVMPVAIMGGVFVWPVPSGLVLYWMTTNLWTCGQQLVIKSLIGPAPIVEDEAPAAAAKEAPPPAEPRPTRSSDRRRARPAPPADAVDGAVSPEASATKQPAGDRRRPRPSQGQGQASGGGRRRPPKKRR